MSTQPLPLLRPSLPRAQALLPYLQAIDDTAHYTNFGPLNQRLITQLVDWQTQRFGRTVHGVTTSSATAALELLLADLALPQGALVLVPALTFVATASAVLRCGHVPVVADIDPHTWLLTPHSLPPQLEGIAAVVAVASFGVPQSVDAWAAWRASTGIPVIIDAAGAFGAQATAPGIAVVFSLHATKSLSAGEGGLVLTEDPAQAQRIAQMSNFGIGELRTETGTNAKLSEYHAAVGLADFEAWPEKSRQRLALRQRYQAVLQAVCGDALGWQSDEGLHSPTIMAVRLPDAACRDQAEQACAQAGIQTRRWYLPLVHQHPALSGVRQAFALPVAQALAQTLLGVPFYLGLLPQDIQRVATVLAQAMTQAQNQNQTPKTSAQSRAKSAGRVKRVKPAQAASPRQAKMFFPL